jgi:serine/threonine-protein kinase
MANPQDSPSSETRTSRPKEPHTASPSDSDTFDHGRFSPGTLIAERYRIVARLGVGGMGEVYRADDLTLGQAVALKFLPEAVERDAGRLDKLIAEVRTARQIAHPNVCRVYDVGHVDGRRFLTMEYVDGEDLRGLLRRIGRFPEDKGLEIARQICAGLAAIHDRGVLHRDLKPANIMIDGRGRVRLTDFGLATAVASAGTDGEIAGTPAYMAPEQFAGQALTPATDLYALGLVLFELFTGERVQKGADVHAIRSAQHTVARTLTTSGSGAKLDPLVQRVIERCLDVDPKRRPQSAIAVAAALPGGDPLAAALAAGETPSPQMVAAAGSEGSLSFAVAVPLLLLLFVGVLSSAWLEGRNTYSASVTIPNSPEILAGKAREMLGRLGYDAAPADTAGGFVADQAYGQWLEQHDTSATRWQHIASVRPAPVRFWHRASPLPMNPQNYVGNSPGGGLGVSRLDPPMTVAGMTYLELDPAGHLFTLDAVVPHAIDPAEPASDPDWSVLFREAGLDMSTFVQTTPSRVGRMAFDAAAAWTGPGADATGAELRVEAAAFRGRPVFFRLIGPWTPSALTDATGPRRGSASQVIVLVVVFAVPFGAILLSLRHLRLGRVDTRGATRLAVVMGALTLAAALLGSHLSPGINWPTVGLVLASWTAFGAMMAWTFYAALEPFARRHWPQMLISWSRLLDGRWRDPLVGRDLLLGCLLGMVSRHLDAFRDVLFEWRGGLKQLPVGHLTVWEGWRLTLADVIGGVPEGMWVGLGTLMLLVLLRVVLRNALAAAIAAVVIMRLPAAFADQDLLVSVVFGVITVGAWVLVATRFGLVMYATFIVVSAGDPSSGFGGGFAAPDFAQGTVLFKMAAYAAIGVFGFYTATRGRKASGWLDG